MSQLGDWPRGPQRAAWEEGHEAGYERGLDVGADGFNPPFGETRAAMQEDASTSADDLELELEGKEREAWIDGFTEGLWDAANDEEIGMARTDAEAAEISRFFPGPSAIDQAAKATGFDAIVVNEIYDAMWGMAEIARTMQGSAQTPRQIEAMRALNKGAAQLNNLAHQLSPGLVPEIITTVIEALEQEIHDRGDYTTA